MMHIKLTWKNAAIFVIGLVLAGAVSAWLHNALTGIGIVIMVLLYLVSYDKNSDK